MWEYYNPNPKGARVGDCAVRAMCKALDSNWEEEFIHICLEGLLISDMPSSNAVWGSYLKANGFTKGITEPLTSLGKFCKEHSTGTYVVALNNHVVTVVNGTFFDTWDSGDEIILYYWQKGEN